MLRRLLLLLAVVCLFPVAARAANPTRAFGWCEDGGFSVVIGGGNGTSTNKFQRSFPNCTVTVYLGGTLTLATIYSDSSSTAKANPFTAAADAQWFFYAAAGNYDVKFSGGGIPAPFTLGDITVGGSGGGGGTITGGGTINNVAKFTGATAVGDSTITDTGSAITLANPVTFTGTTTLNGQTFTWPASQVANGCLKTNGSGTLSFAACSVAATNIVLQTTDYNFTPQTPAANLSVAGVVTISMTPCPPGVDASDNSTTHPHYLYISGGTGTAESVLITQSGGLPASPCTSGLGTGNIKVLTNNTHTGAWTIGSATAGMAEAVESAPNGAVIQLPAQGIGAPINVFAATTFAGFNGYEIRGAGEGNTFIVPKTAGGTIGLNYRVFDVFVTQGMSIHDLYVYDSVAHASGGAIRVQGFSGGYNTETKIYNVSTQHMNVGLDMVAASAWSVWANRFLESTLYGVVVQNIVAVDAGDSAFFGNEIGQNITDETGTGARLMVIKSSGGLKVFGNKFNGGGSAGLVDVCFQIDPASANTGILLFEDNSIENCKLYGFYIDNEASTAWSRVIITGNHFNAPATGSGQIGVLLDNPGATEWLIADNIFKTYGSTSTVGIQVNQGGDIDIHGNLFQGLNTAIYDGYTGTSNNLKIGINTYTNINFKITNQGDPSTQSPSYQPFLTGNFTTSDPQWITTENPTYGPIGDYTGWYPFQRYILNDVANPRKTAIYIEDVNTQTDATFRVNTGIMIFHASRADNGHDVSGIVSEEWLDGNGATFLHNTDGTIGPRPGGLPASAITRQASFALEVGSTGNTTNAIFNAHANGIAGAFGVGNFDGTGTIWGEGLRIYPEVDANNLDKRSAIVVSNVQDNLSTGSVTFGVYLNGTVIDSGPMLVNTLVKVPTNNISRVPSIVTAGAGLNSGIVSGRTGTSTGGGGSVDLLTTRGANLATPTSVIAGDGLGIIEFFGADGAQFIRSAQVAVQADTPISTGIVPSKMIFTVTNAAGATITPLILLKDGSLQFNMTPGSGGADSTLCISAGNIVTYIAGLCTVEEQALLDGHTQQIRDLTSRVNDLQSALEQLRRYQ